MATLIGLEVETLARSGDQTTILCVMALPLDLREARWDYAIVEGRHINSVDGTFRPFAKNTNIEHFASDGEWWDKIGLKDFYNFWQCDLIQRQIFTNNYLHSHAKL